MTSKPRPRKKGDQWLVALAWGINVAALIAVVLAAALYFIFYPVSAAPKEIVKKTNYTATMPATYTPNPFALYLPTITPNPFSTLIVAQTPTPFVIENFSTQGRAEIITAGTSVSGRPIEVYAFGNGERQKMIVAGIHGGYEWNTIALADELIQYIFDRPDIIPSDVTLYILRNLNPDGDARDRGVDGRVNDHGADLNRNFPENWASEWNRAGCWRLAETNGGTGPGSEPETQAVMYFLQSHKIETLISYHSAALGVFPGGEPWDADSKKFAKALSKATRYPYPPLETGCVYTGTLADYAVSLGITAVDMELATHENTDFKANLKALDILLNWK
ncbi:MAG: M14 family metallopeptidase [Anaerolineales bacterium]|nr:M14 family metallopeptidase [Anaerolineales bacterium]